MGACHFPTHRVSPFSFKFSKVLEGNWSDTCIKCTDHAPCWSGCPRMNGLPRTCWISYYYFFFFLKKKNRPFTTPRYTLPYSDVQGPPPRSIARYVALYKGSKDLSSDPHGNEAAYNKDGMVRLQIVVDGFSFVLSVFVVLKSAGTLLKRTIIDVFHRSFSRRLCCWDSFIVLRPFRCLTSWI